MEHIEQLLPLFVSLSLTGLVLSVGLKATRYDVLFVLQRPRMLLKAIVAVYVIPPLAAGLLIAFLPLAPLVKAGIMLMAIAPISPLFHIQQLKVGARKEYMFGVYVAMALLAILVVPIVLAIVSRAFGRNDAITFAAMARTVIGNVLIPLAIGMVIGRLAPAFADRAGPLVYKLSLLFVVLAFLPILGLIWRDIVSLIANGAFWAMAATAALALAGGHWLGGPERLDRATLAIAGSVRHPGVAVMIADSAFKNTGVEAAVLLFMVVGLIVGIAYKIWLKRSAPPTARDA